MSRPGINVIQVLAGCESIIRIQIRLVRMSQSPVRSSAVQPVSLDCEPCLPRRSESPGMSKYWLRAAFTFRMMFRFAVDYGVCMLWMLQKLTCLQSTYQTLWRFHLKTRNFQSSCVRKSHWMINRSYRPTVQYSGQDAYKQSAEYIDLRMGSPPTHRMASIGTSDRQNQGN